LETRAEEPWKKAFRWLIPHLPSGDSVEFSFQAIAPPSGEFITALYNAERVVIERVAGEPRSAEKWNATISVVLPLLIGGVSAAIIAAAGTVGFNLGYRNYGGVTAKASGDNSSIPALKSDLSGSGCSLRVTSEADYRRDIEAWSLFTTVLNTGDNECHLTVPGIFNDERLLPGQITLSRTRYIVQRPRPIKAKISFSTEKREPSENEVSLFLPANP
jgi:hypothetical protein